MYTQTKIILTNQKELNITQKVIPKEIRYMKTWKISQEKKCQEKQF